ncbi:MAG TPA: YlxR family protein [bacterium]|nr:YlxR family protein [bacterium]HRR92086.1 YlxR family protein [bacterium]HRU32250.1 YlxR family protein [bacterium]
MVKTPEGLIKLDPLKMFPGRGAYICGKIECISNFGKKNYLAYALKTRIEKDKLMDIKRELENLLQRGDVKR